MTSEQSTPSMAEWIAGEPDVESDLPYDPNRNKHGIQQRCRHCGKDFETQSRQRNYELNVHRSNCSGRATTSDENANEGGR